MTENRSSRAATIASWFGKFAPSCALAGIVGIQIGILPPLGGYVFFMIGLLAALFAIGFGIAGLIKTRAGGDEAGKSRAWLGLASGAVLLTIAVFASGGRSAPPINDITTNLDDPPAFASAADVPDYAGRDMSYPEGFVEIVRTHYPELQTTLVGEDVASAFARSKATAEALGWTVVFVDPEGGHLDAQDSSALFKFIDDVTIRVRDVGGETHVDVRSKSRDGRGDLGVNAKRIREFQAALLDAG